MASANMARAEAADDRNDPAADPQPTLAQLAALCHRKGKSGREVLLVTSSAGRWILPKGWPIDGLPDREAALIEAWEEGGVKKGKAARKPLGSYVGTKRVAGGLEEPCLMEVFEVKVSETAKTYPESDRRDRIWVSPDRAAEMVSDEGLRAILRAF